MRANVNVSLIDPALIIDTIPTMAWSVRPDGSVDFLNRRWRDYTGLSSPKDIKEPNSVIHPDDLPRVMKKWVAGMAAGEPYEDKMRLRRADGEYHWFQVCTAPLRDQNGKIVKWYGTSTLIEPPKLAEEKAHQSKEHSIAVNVVSPTAEFKLEELIGAKTPLFNEIAENDVRTMLSQAVVADYAPRSWLYRQGEICSEFFLLQSGLVRLTELTPEGDEILVRFVAPGDVVGYFSLVVGGPNVLSAQAIQPSRVVVWDRVAAQRLLQSIPRAASNLLNIAVRDIVYCHNRTRRMLVDPVAHRVEWALSEVVRIAGVRSLQHEAIVLDIGHRELAELAATNVYTVSRVLGKLERQGVLQKGRRHIVVLQPTKLFEKR